MFACVGIGNTAITVQDMGEAMITVYADHIQEGPTYYFIVQSLKSLLERQLLKKSDMVVILGGNFEWTQSASFIEISTVENMLNLLHKGY